MNHNLFFVLSKSSSIPYYRQLVSQVIYGIRNGSLKSGDRLPPVRILSANLAININTIARVYKELKNRGYILTRKGVGTVISDSLAEAGKKDAADWLDTRCGEFLDDAATIGYCAHDAIDALEWVHRKRLRNNG